MEHFHHPSKAIRLVVIGLEDQKRRERSAQLSGCSGIQRHFPSEQNIFFVTRLNAVVCETAPKIIGSLR